MKPAPPDHASSPKFSHSSVDTGAGLIEVIATCKCGKCKGVTFNNIPSFVFHRNSIIDVPSIGELRVDVAYGGMIYCIVDAADAGIGLERSDARQLVETGEAIKKAAAIQLPSVHPTNPGIHTINQVEFTGPLEIIDGVKTSKNAVIVSPGRLDRCPCGTGTSARMALLHARGDLEVGELFRHTSILDTQFDCKILEETNEGSVPAILPQISGRAWLTGISHYGIDPEDPFPSGYRLGDTWFT